MTAALHVESVGDGAPIVLLHGWGMHGGLWGALPARLARFARVHVVDLPGHGHSARDSISSLEDMVDRLATQFRDAPVTVLGWSLGALAAMRWAVLASRQVMRLVLTGATPRFVNDPTWTHGIAESSLLRFGDELRVAYKLTLQRFLSLQLQGTEGGRESLANMRHRLFARGAPEPAALDQGLAVLRTTDLRGEVAHIAQPTLVIAGDRDTLTPVAASRWLVQHLPHATLHVIEGAAHVPFLSHADAFGDAVESFVHEC